MATSDLKSLLPDALLENRREFLVSKLAVGFALAVHPIGAQTITTDTKGLTAGEVQIPMADGKMIPAYRARPSGGHTGARQSSTTRAAQTTAIFTSLWL